MIEIVPGVRQWSRYSEEKGLDFNGLLIERGGEKVLVDPPPVGKKDEPIVRRGGKVSAVILTNLHHSRSAVSWRESDGARILAPRADREGLSIPVDGVYGDGDRLPAGLLAIGLHAMKTPGEMALYLDVDAGVMVLGDALIGKPPGKLSLLPPDKVPDRAGARASLRRLLSWRWDALMLGDGRSFPVGGRAALERYLTEAD